MFASRFAYTFFMIVAALVAGFLVRNRQRGLGIESGQKLAIATGGLIGATVAARLPFLIGVGGGDTLSLFWMGDGKTILWGLAGGYLGVEIAKWTMSVRHSTGDTFVVPVAIAVAIGRLGCLFYGCCYGIATNQSWGFRFPTAPDAGALLRHPTQLYEIAFHATFASLAWIGISNRQFSPLFHGSWMPLYLLSYAIYRFTSEFWRPEPPSVFGLTFYQCSAIFIGASFATLLMIRYMRGFQPITDSE